MVRDLGLIDYQDAYRVQMESVRRRKRGEVGDSVIMAEHMPVFTIGRSGARSNLLKDEAYLEALGIKILNVDRGGDITFHGPGQVVIYPIIDLRKYGSDLHLYMRTLEEAAIQTLGDYGVCGERRKGRTGVWAGGGKVASIGIAATNWITYHGLSLNINIDLAYFAMINPCGYKDVRMASLESILGRKTDIRNIKQAILSRLLLFFDLEEHEMEHGYASGLA